MGVDITGWSWNAKIADLDNDGWQDIYVVNGTWLRAHASPSNFFFRNEAGKRFSVQTEAFGLDDFMIVSSYTYIDIDNDGDLDIVTSAVNGPIKTYLNNETQNNSIAVALQDHHGNRFGIGAKIIIHYGPEGAQHQLREIKSGGGFISFDAPVAYFGLGQSQTVDRIDIVWSTGEETTLEGPFEVGSKYLIKRR
jgi:hypothetical protein